MTGMSDLLDGQALWDYDEAGELVQPPTATHQQRAEFTLAAQQARFAVLAFNPGQRRGPDGQWIKMGGSGSAGGKTRKRRRVAQAPDGFDMSQMSALGWEPDDPDLIRAAQLAHRYGFTGFTPDATGGAAAFDKRRPDTLMIGPKSKWTGEGFAHEKARAGGRYYMENAGDDAVAYYIHHEAGHRTHHLDTGLLNTERVGRALAQFAAERGITKSESGDPETQLPIAAADFDTWGDPNAFMALMPHGLSRYGAMNIQELIAETHAAYQLGSSNELVNMVARSEGWTRV